MCQYLNLITDSVNELMNKGSGYMFTAFDVTKAVRKQTTDKVIHEEVKKEVHKMFNNGQMPGYARNLAALSLPNNVPQPWVYHPLNSDPTLYNGDPTYGVLAHAQIPTSPALPATPATPAIPATVVIDSITTAADGTYEFDTTNRLCVPNSLVRQAGMKAGDDVTVLVDHNNDLVLTQDQNLAGHLLTTYVVDKYDNIRVTMATLQKAGINGVAFDIQGDHEKITVKKVK